MQRWILLSPDFRELYYIMQPPSEKILDYAILCLIPHLIHKLSSIQTQWDKKSATFQKLLAYSSFRQNDITQYHKLYENGSTNIKRFSALKSHGDLCGHPSPPNIPTPLAEF